MHLFRCYKLPLLRLAAIRRNSCLLASTSAVDLIIALSWRMCDMGFVFVIGHLCHWEGRRRGHAAADFVDAL